MSPLEHAREIRPRPAHDPGAAHRRAVRLAYLRLRMLLSPSDAGAIMQAALDALEEPGLYGTDEKYVMLREMAAVYREVRNVAGAGCGG